MDERVAQYYSLYYWLLSTIVRLSGGKKKKTACVKWNINMGVTEKSKRASRGCHVSVTGVSARASRRNHVGVVDKSQRHHAGVTRESLSYHAGVTGKPVKHQGYTKCASQRHVNHVRVNGAINAGVT